MVPGRDPGALRPGQWWGDLHTLRQGTTRPGAWAEVSHDGCESHSTLPTFHLQMVDCEGNVALYTLKTMQLSARYWPHSAPGARPGFGGFAFPPRPPGSYGMLVRLEPAPPSIHLTARPDLVGTADACPRSSPPAAGGAGGGPMSRRGRSARLYAYVYANQVGASHAAPSICDAGPAAPAAAPAEAAPGRVLD